MMTHRKYRSLDPSHRQGAVLVLMAVMTAFMLTLVAFAVDIGYLQCAKTDLQRSADAAAIAACWELRKSPSSTTPDMTSTQVSAARSTAVTYAGLNKVLNATTALDSNASNSTSGDVVVGYMSNPSSAACTMDTSQLSKDNAVQVTVRRSSAENGTVPFFFAKALGFSSKTMSATATAAILSSSTLHSFKMPSDGSELDILPFALDKKSWDDLLAGTQVPGSDGGLGYDNYSYDSSTKTVSSGSDGVRELDLYPHNYNGTAAGNRGTVDIGSSNNSNSDIKRQILNGVNQSDLSYLGGSISFDSNGYLYLNGDTGISAGVKADLESIKGKPRMIPIFDGVPGPNGNNAYYGIVEFVGVRITDVQLTGKMSKKHVTIQPADVSTLGGSSSGSPPKYNSTFIYSPVWLVR